MSEQPTITSADGEFYTRLVPYLGLSPAQRETLHVWFEAHGVDYRHVPHAPRMRLEGDVLHVEIYDTRDGRRYIGSNGFPAMRWVSFVEQSPLPWPEAQPRRAVASGGRVMSEEPLASPEACFAGVPPPRRRRKSPLCCGEPMVHNTWAERWECADAYFTLFDQGWDGGDPRDGDDLNVEVPIKAGCVEDVSVDDLREAGADWLIPYLKHWRASWITDKNMGNPNT